MKKILFSAYSLDIGGIETALLTLLNELVNRDYEIILVLEKKQGIFLNDLNKKIKVIQYSPSNNRNIFLRKFINLMKRLKFFVKNKNKYNFSASFATYSLSSSFVARHASKNNALWVHSNYMNAFKNDKNKFINFFENIKINKFKNIVFVSNESKKVFINEFKELEKKCKVINNILDYKKIIELSSEKIKYNKNTKTILYVGRLTEEDKKISRIIESAKRLKEDNIKFKILFIGDGKDKQKYIELVKKYKLENEIVFLGKQKNPYPYFKISDFLILTSEYEGYPVVYNEARILNLPILTTNVSDSKEIIENKYGIVTEKNIEDIYINMKKMLTKDYNIKEKFDCIKYNDKNIKLIENIINNTI